MRWLLLSLVLMPSVAFALKLPPGFQAELIPGEFTLNVALAHAPDGRVFFSDKNTGRILIIKNGAYLAAPLIDKAVNWSQERGALGVTVDPNFISNHYVYFFYSESSTGSDTSVKDSVTVNRLIRFTEDADTVVAGSEVVLREFPINPASATHNSGNLHFGPDGMLYVSLGDNMQETPPVAQDLSDIRGSILRLEPNGDAADDNFFALDGDTNTIDAIYTYGHRNPFDFTFHPNGQLLSTENGPSYDDEINWIIEGKNYGWNIVVGFPDTPAESTWVDAHPNYMPPLWTSGSPTTCPTGIVAIDDSSTWGQYTGECILVGRCNAPYYIAKFPLYWIDDEPVLGPEEIFVDSVGARIIDLEFDANGDLWIGSWPNIYRMYVPTVDVVRGRPTSFLRISGSPGRGPFTIHGSAGSVVRIYNIAGRKMDTLEMPNGSVVWAPKVPSGVYFVRSDGEASRVVLVR